MKYKTVVELRKKFKKIMIKDLILIIGYGRWSFFITFSVTVYFYYKTRKTPQEI